MTVMAAKELVFSGVQPTGNLHLGNYLGAIVNFVKLQNTHNCIYCVVDLHAITVWQDPAELTRNIREVTAAFIASGIDPKKHIVFNQSQVSGHAELAWVFNCVARLGWLNRMTQFKEKAGKDRENASVGLYAYPNLMAADILVYRATHVPVGEDQKQHLELARDIAQKFNNDFADSIRAHNFDEKFFPQPEPLITGPATRVMSLRDGSKKMSKSDPSDYSRINLSDDADAIAQKVRKAKTDPEPLPSEEEGLKSRPEADNLVGIYAALSGKPKADMLARIRRRSVFRLQIDAGRSRRRKARADRRGNEEADAGCGLCGFGSDRRRRPRTRRRGRDHECGEGHCRLHPQALKRVRYPSVSQLRKVRLIVRSSALSELSIPLIGPRHMAYDPGVVPGSEVRWKSPRIKFDANFRTSDTSKRLGCPRNALRAQNHQRVKLLLVLSSVTRHMAA